MFRFTREPRGVLRVDITGRWTAGVVDRYLIALLHNAASIRRSTGRLRLLVHVEHSELSPDALARLKLVEGSVIESPDDRIAIVLPSSLDKAQLKSVSATDQVASFLSSNAANVWLLAYG